MYVEMERGLFRFIMRHSQRDQFFLVLLSILSLPILYATLELPKTIINQAIDGHGGFPKTVLGADFAQIPYLMLLCGSFLGLVLITGAFKYFTSTYRYRIGDALLRRLRYELIERVMRFPLMELRNTSSAPIVSMVTAETSSLGFFMAEAFAVPAVAAGTLATISLFMFLQNWMMGVAAIALYPAQIYLIPKIQKKVNALQRDEVVAVRHISERIGEVVAAVQEIHGHDTSQYELKDFSRRLDGVFDLRVQIGSKRYMANVLNAFFSQLTPFFFLSIGGYLVIVGQLSLGALVAVLAAYKDMYAPWKDLIDYYQKAEDARVKFDQITEYFDPAGLMDRNLLNTPSDSGSLNGSRLIASNVVVEAEEGVKSLDGASITLDLPTHTAFIGGIGSGREDLARLLARQVFPRSGRLTIGDRNLASLPDSVTGRLIGYVTSEVYLSAGSIRSSLLYPLCDRAPAPLEAPFQEPEVVDYDTAGCVGLEDLSDRIMEILKLVDLESDIYEMGLRRSIDPVRYPQLTERIVATRLLLMECVRTQHLTSLVNLFDPESYNVNASVAENILFGTPLGPTFAVDRLGENPYMLGIIAETGLTEVFLDAGRKLAVIMEDIFRDLAPGHDFFERFSFITGEDMPVYTAILRKSDAHGMGNLDEAECQRLMNLPFRLVVAQHHVGLIDAALQQRLLQARRAFAENLPENLRGAVQFFDVQTYNADASIADNLLFGKTASGKAGSATQIGNLMTEVLRDSGVRRDVVEAGLEYEIGIGGSRLSTAQRQKLALARCLIKRPDMLVLDDALSALDPAAQSAVLAHVRSEMAGRSLILLEPAEARSGDFERVFLVENGKIAEATKGDRSKIAAPNESTRTPGGDVGLNDAVAMLTRIPLFAGIDRSKLKLLVFTSQQQSFEAGQVVFGQGDPGHHAYVVIDGRVDVILEGQAEHRTVATLGPNQVFGEMALLTNAPRTTTIRAVEAVNLLVINNDIFMRLMEDNSEIAVSMTRILAQRLASTLRDYAKAT